ncbi:MAG: hypothetical protein Q8M94_09080, partial [Ignavibacteria bacterium]|nr:hypothetical protein [Ignavibacteria bacterium]
RYQHGYGNYDTMDNSRLGCINSDNCDFLYQQKETMTTTSDYKPAASTSKPLNNTSFIIVFAPS